MTHFQYTSRYIDWKTQMAFLLNVCLLNIENLKYLKYQIVNKKIKFEHEKFEHEKSFISQRFMPTCSFTFFPR